MSLVRRLRTAQQGFTMVSVMLGMMVAGMMIVGAWQLAVGDIGSARADTDRKRAYEAAEAGIEWYAYQLARDPAYWTQCTAVPALAPGVPAPVNNAWSGTGTDTRTRWRALPGSDARYAVELLPADGYSACSTSDPSQSMLQDGTLRIRATGIARGDRRQIVATFRRRSFLEFIYFTDRETYGPVIYDSVPSYVAAGYNSTWAQTNCNQRRSARHWACLNIQFADDDFVKGPLHTNDESLLTCNGATFGRDASDNIEVAGPPPGYVRACGGNPVMQGTLVAPADTMTMPPSNGSLAAVADYVLTGTKCLNFQNTGHIQVYNGRVCTGTPASTLSPPGGSAVIYVNHSGACAGTYDYRQRYTTSLSCGDVYVQGTYGKNITVGAANDVIIRGDLRRNGDRMLGLVANNFVRVYHPARDASGNCTTNQAGSLSNPVIEAAILALNQSWIADNWDCGGSLGNLRVEGAIAQKWRGPVGTSGGNGYIKDYEYDDRLRYKSPPQFLDPVQSAWRLLRQSERQPAR